MKMVFLALMALLMPIELHIGMLRVDMNTIWLLHRLELVRVPLLEVRLEQRHLVGI